MEGGKSYSSCGLIVMPPIHVLVVPPFCALVVPPFRAIVVLSSHIVIVLLSHVIVVCGCSFVFVLGHSFCCWHWVRVKVAMSPSGDVAVVIVSLGVVVMSLGGGGMVVKWHGGSLSCGLVVVSSSHGGGVAVGGCGCHRVGVVNVFGPLVFISER